MNTPLSLYDRVMSTRDALAQRTPARPVIGFVLGSGLGRLVGALKDPQVVPYAELEHVPRSTVPGHAGKLVLGHVDGRSGPVHVAMLSGRAHLYEGHDVAELTIAVRALIALGCRAMVLTNAAGGIHTEYRPGDLMVITDHLNLQWKNPLSGPHDERLGARFIDMTHAYDRPLRARLHEAARGLKVRLHDGIYAAVPGPSYETPAEVRMLRTLGADAVGMSTVHETIAARHAGARVVGLSLISNVAAGIEDAALSHEEVTATADRVAQEATTLLERFIPMAAEELA